MQANNLHANRQFTVLAIGVALVGILLAVANIFVLGGDAFVQNLNQHLTPPLAIIAALSAFSQWRRETGEKTTRRVWLGMATGLFLWAIAEVVWWIYAVLRQENPYPSTADLFFIAGFIPLLYGLIVRYRSTLARPSWQQLALISSISILVGAVIHWLIGVPIIQDFDPHRMLESVLNILYPVLDFVLFILVLLIYSAYERDYSLPWRIIAIALAFMSFSDLLFSYLTWNDLYYPGGKSNLLTGLSDFAYNYAYLTLAFGIYTYRLVYETQHRIIAPTSAHPTSREPNANVLVFTNGDNIVISMSKNFPNLFKTESRDYLIGVPLGRALGLSEGILASLLKHITSRGYIVNHPVRVIDASGGAHPTSLTAIAVYDSGQNYKGAQILLRTYLDDVENPDKDVSWESQGLINYILAKTGIQEDESRELLRAYFLAHLDLFYTLADQVGGARMIEIMEKLLNDTAEQYHWNVRFRNKEASIPDEYGAMNLAKILSALMQTGKTYLSDIIDRDRVSREIETLNHQLDGKLIRTADLFKLRNT
jgi:hypothetical protein